MCLQRAGPGRMSRPIEMRPQLRPLRPLLALGLALLLAALAETRPELAALRVFSAPKSLLPSAPDARLDQPVPVGEAELAGTSGPVDAPAPESAEPPRSQASPRPALFGASDESKDRPPTEAPPVSLSHAENLAAFFESLAQTKTAEGGTPHLTRVLHFGDSLIVSDYVSSSLRRLMQKEFGDAGHGFQLIANAWPSYSHADVSRSSSGGFRASRISGPKTADRLYGLGGVTFRGGSGLRAQFGTAARGEFGRNVSTFSVSYLQTPGGGGVQVLADGQELAQISTAGPVLALERAFQVPDGPHRFELVLKGGESRLFGVVMERRVSGVVWDALGVQGARLSTLSENDEGHFADQLRARHPNLIAFQFGINESGDGYAVPMPELNRTMLLLLKRARAAVPNASCLVIGAMDRARVEEGNVVSMRVIPLIVREQRAASEAAGCAFFDTYAAMGGAGSMPRWVKRGLANADMMHPSGVGAERIGTWIFRALMEGYRAHDQAKEPEPAQ
jgi:hypothetical protein